MKKYLGYLDNNDPLYGYLKYDIQPQLSGFFDDPVYRVYRLNGSNAVYLYEEKNTQTKVIGKYFYSEREENKQNAAHHLEKEYQRLETIRRFGFDCHPFYVAKPLGKNADLGELLVVEYCEGELLSRIISRAISEKDNELLFDKLSLLAYFFAELHNRTATPAPLDFDNVCHYMDQVVRQCSVLMNEKEIQTFYSFRQCWHDKSQMWQDCPVLVHGDATPENFLFSSEDTLMTFDLERSIYTDRVFDIGRMAGELKHFFLMNTANTFAAEPFIGHFLWEYATHFPDRESAFYSITRRVPFYMGVTLLRIARNFWIAPDYRRKLIDEAKNCFQEGKA